MSRAQGLERRVMLRRCLAIIIRKEGCQGDPGDFWMYESGYLLFQGLIAANSVCWWSSALQGATKCLTYRGYVSPGALLVSSEPCSLEILRGAWARRVLQPPAGYQIIGIEDIEDCLISSVSQTQWTPLPEAVCAVVLRLSSQGRPAGIESIREALILAFPHVSPPSERALYDTLVQLSTERKLYHTSKGYFIVTPERRRSRSHSRNRRKYEDGTTSKSMLMSTEEAMVLVHGEMATIRDGDITHQCIQTNLADVICGGNASDKILYPRTSKRRSASFPAHRSPDRRGSFRLWGSARRLRRSASTRTISKHCSDSSSSTDYPNSSDSAQTPKKPSLLSRIFRRSRRAACQINSFSAQFPPMEWFNSKAIHLHSIGTQTNAADKDSGTSIPCYYSNSEVASSRSATLPRRHRRQPSNDSTYVTSREHSPSLRQMSPLHHTSSTLPRNTGVIRSPLHSIQSNVSSRKTSHSSLSPKVCTSNNAIHHEKESSQPAYETTKTSSLDSLKPSHISKSSLSKNGITESSPSAIQDLTANFKNSVSLDNSGPSSIESHKSSLTSGPSSLESHRTVISNPALLASKHPPRKTETNRKSSNTTNPKIPHSNSFTLQVTTNQSGTSCTKSSNNAMTATINGGNSANTKIYVQNSPVRSVITFENGNVDSKPNVVIINGNEQNSQVPESSKYSKNTNNVGLNNSPKVDEKTSHMNNSRKLSLQLPPTKDGLNYKNVFKNGQQNQTSPESPFDGFTRNSFCSSLPSPTKSFDSICEFNKYITDSKTSDLVEKNMLGSEPNISCKVQDYRDKTLTRDSLKNEQFPSLSDLSFNFTSLAAQKILKGVSINSIDTLVELNNAAIEKQNNCDVVHTDFGLV